MDQSWGRGHTLGIFNRVIVSLTVIVSGSMLLAGAWLTYYLQVSDIRSAARMAAGYFELIIHGSAREDRSDHGLTLPPGGLRGILLPAGRIEAVVFWRPDGEILYSADPDQIGRVFDNPNLDRAMREGTLSHITTGRSDRDGKAGGANTRLPLLEIYVPLDRGPDGVPRLIGEIYLDAGALLAAGAQRKRLVWAGIALTGGTILTLLLYTLVRARRVVLAQQMEIDTQLVHTRKLLATNHALRNEADTAREELIRGNEAVLNALAADLHDGPLQMLAVAALSLDDAAGPRDRRGIHDLLSRTMGELRDLSTGLGLPELAGLGARDTILLAISRHTGMTGAEVACDLPQTMPDLETATQICLFRVIQEGLTNAFKHGHDPQPEVHIRLRGRALVVAISNRKHSSAVQPGLQDRVGLGIQGIRRRVLALGGTVRHRQRAPGHMLMVVRLPLG